MKQSPQYHVISSPIWSKSKWEASELSGPNLLYDMLQTNQESHWKNNLEHYHKILLVVYTLRAARCLPAQHTSTPCFPVIVKLQYIHLDAELNRF